MSAGLDPPHVFAPGDTDNPGVPLLLLHGTGGDERDLLPLAQGLSPTSPVLSPRGSVLEGAMPRFLRRQGEGVFDEDDLRLRTDELAHFVLAASVEYGVAPGSWWAVGFSNGANIASSLLMRRPEVLAGAVLLAAMVPYAQPPHWCGPAPAHGRGLQRSSRPDGDASADADPGRAAACALGARVEELPHSEGHTIDAALLPRIAELIG